MPQHPTLRGLILGAVLAAGLVPGVPFAAAASAQRSDPETDRMKRENLTRLLRPITLSVNDQRLADVISFVADFTGAQIDPHYIDDSTPDGLDPEAPITIDATNISALRLLELVIEQAARDSFDGATWQFTEWGSVELGLKSTLNRRQRVQIYDISDLLLVLPDYDDAPEIDLQSVLQSSQGGGGGGQSPFSGDGGNAEDEERDLEERRDQVIGLIESIVEPEQWQSAGGGGGTITVYQNALIVRAADYMHRQINGYSFWPSSSQTAAVVGARRYVSFDLDTGISTIDGFSQDPVVVAPGGGG
jgi:hypothetical protein